MAGSEHVFLVMAKEEVHSRSNEESGSLGEPESDSLDRELLTEHQISDREFLEIQFGRRLRAFAAMLCEGKTYGGDGPDDLVQRVIGKVAEHKKKWQGLTAKGLEAVLYRSVENDFVDLTRKYGSQRHGELEETEIVARGIAPMKQVLREVDLSSYLRFVKQHVPNDSFQHAYLDLWLTQDCTVEEAAEKLGLSVNKVRKMRVQLLEQLREVLRLEMIRGY